MPSSPHQCHMDFLTLGSIVIHALYMLNCSLGQVTCGRSIAELHQAFLMGSVGHAFHWSINNVIHELGDETVNIDHTSTMKASRREVYMSNMTRTGLNFQPNPVTILRWQETLDIPKSNFPCLKTSKWDCKHCSHIDHERVKGSRTETYLKATSLVRKLRMNVSKDREEKHISLM